MTGALAPSEYAAGSPEVIVERDLGLVNRLVEPGQALSQARSLAAMIAGNGPPATDAREGARAFAERRQPAWQGQ